MDGQVQRTEPQEPAAESTFPVWPVIIIGLLVGHVTLMLVMVYLAVSDRSFAVEPDYYEKAMRWDETRAAERASAALGWHATLSVANHADMREVRTLQCVLVDQKQHPIQNAAVEIVAFSHARGRQRHLLTLDPGPRGQYHGQLRIAHAGYWEFRITARRGDDLFTETQLVQVAPATGEPVR